MKSLPEFLFLAVLLRAERSEVRSSTAGRELRGCLVSQAAVRTLVIVLLLASLGEPAGFRQIRELLAVQKLVSQPAEERLRKAVLPRASRFNVQHLQTAALRVTADRLGNEFRPVVATSTVSVYSFCVSLSGASFFRAL